MTSKMQDTFFTDESSHDKFFDTLFIPYFNRDAHDYKRFFYAELPDKAKKQMNRAMTKKEDTHGYDYHMCDSRLKVNKI